MRFTRLLLVAVILLLCVGCTEMRVEGDARIFQTSSLGATLRTLTGVALLGLGVLGLLGSVLPDRNLGRRLAPHEKTSGSHRAAAALFGMAMLALGFAITVVPLLFSGKLHVTVLPDRVEMASTFSQTGGRELVVPFADVTSVDISEERNLIGKKPQKKIVFTTRNGSAIKADASNNEMQALATIREALAQYHARPVVVATPPAGGHGQPTQPVVSNPAHAPQVSGQPQQGPTTVERVASTNPPVTPVAPAVSPTFAPPSPPLASSPKPSPAVPNNSAKEYSLKRYVIKIPIPDGHALVTRRTPVDVGMKLSASFGGRWDTVTVVAVNSDGTISCSWDTWRVTYKMLREDLITPAVRGGAGNVSAPSATAAATTAKEYTLKRYPIAIPVPDGYAVVKPDTQVEVGMKLGACYVKHWEHVTVVAINSDGTISCNWDKFKAFTYKMVREDLIIANKP